MGIHVLLIKRIVTKGGPGGAVCLSPDFGSLDMTGRKWGQASSKLGDETTQAVWIECSNEEAATLIVDGATLLGTAMDDATLAAVASAISVERPPRFDEMVQKRASAKQAGSALFSLKAEATDAEIASKFRELIALQSESVAVANEVAAFQRPAAKQFSDAIGAIVMVEEAKIATVDDIDTAIAKAKG